MKLNRLKLDIAFAKSGLTSQSIRTRHGISSTTIAKAKKGEDIRPAAVGRIAKALNIEVEYLLAEEV